MAEQVQGVKKPVISWRQRILDAGAVVTKPWRKYRASVFQGYLIAAILVFLVLAVLAHTVAYFAFDVIITRDVQTVYIPGFDALMKAISWIGFLPQVNLITLLAIVLLWISGLKWETVVATVSEIGITLLGFLIKVVVDRPRPSPDLVNVLTQLHDFSFPSGHVLYFTTFFGFLLFLTYTLFKHSWWRTVLLLFLGGLIALVGISRIYEGQHWASDVLAAYLLGSVWLALSVYVYQWGKPRFFASQPVAKETPGKPKLDQ